MVKLIALVGHQELMDNRAVGVGCRVKIDHGDAVWLRAIGAEHHHKAVVFRRGLHGKLRGGVKCRIWS